MAGLRSHDKPQAGAGGERGLDPAGTGGPELDLPAPRSAPAVSAPASQPSGRNLLDEMDDDDELGGPGPAIELDTRGGAPLPPRVSQPAIPAADPPEDARPAVSPPAPQTGPAPERSLPPSGAPVPDARSDGPAPVSGRVSTPRAASLEVDVSEARALADYEEPPDAFWATPVYAYRVFTRWLQLRREGADARDDAVRASARAQDASARQAAHAKAVRARLYEVGIGEFDRGKALLGAGLAAGAALVLLILLLFPFLYRALVVD